MMGSEPCCDGVTWICTQGLNGYVSATPTASSPTFWANCSATRSGFWARLISTASKSESSNSCGNGCGGDGSSSGGALDCGGVRWLSDVITGAIAWACWTPWPFVAGGLFEAMEGLAAAAATPG